MTTTPSKTSSFVEATFYSRVSKELVVRNIWLPTGVSGRHYKMHMVCGDYAFDNGFTHWISYDQGTDSWAIFACTGRAGREFVRDFPTRGAAEMWLVHCVGN